MEKKILVGLIDDHLLFRHGMKLILSGRPEVEIVFESSEGYSVIEKLNKADRLPDIMLVDLFLPAHDKMEFSGKEVIMQLQNHFPLMKVIILSGHKEENLIADLIESGAHGYLVKDCDPQEVYNAVYSVQTTGAYINSHTLLALQRRVKTRSPLHSLSKREVEVLELICKQFTSEEIALKLFISVRTVNSHRLSLLEKTSTKNTAGLVIYAIKKGIVQL